MGLFAFQGRDALANMHTWQVLEMRYVSRVR